MYVCVYEYEYLKKIYLYALLTGHKKPSKNLQFSLFSTLLYFQHLLIVPHAYIIQPNSFSSGHEWISTFVSCKQLINRYILLLVAAQIADPLTAHK